MEGKLGPIWIYCRNYNQIVTLIKWQVFQNRLFLFFQRKLLSFQTADEKSNNLPQHLPLSTALRLAAFRKFVILSAYIAASARLVTGT